MQTIKTQMVKAKKEKNLKGTCQLWFQTFQSENNLLEQSWGYTGAQQSHKKSKSL